MVDIRVKDETALRNLELTRQAVRDGTYGEPFLDLDTKAYGDYREGRSSRLPAPWGADPACALMMDGAKGEQVLCLAGAGGQQSAVFSLLGADVTVLDLTPEHLVRDVAAAEHYGYEVRTVQGDIRDLSDLPRAHFSRVFQPISSLYVPDMREVYRGVAQVLKPGGLYFSDYVYPVLYMPENVGWDGQAYVLRFSQPHISGRVLERKSDGVLNFQEGDFFGEFNHLLSDIVNGQISEGLVIVGLWESPRLGQLSSTTFEYISGKLPFSELAPGSKEHQDSVLPFGLSVVSILAP